MDPMDMDEPQPQTTQNTTHRYQCQLPHLSSAPNSFSPQARDGQHYDPVHDSNGWYQANNPVNTPSRTPYTTAQNVPHWGGNSFMPIHSWQGFSELQNQETSSSRPPRFLDGHWNEVRGYGPLPLSYNSQNNPPGSSNMPSELAHGENRSQAPLSLASMHPRYGADLRTVHQALFLYGQGRTQNGASNTPHDHVQRRDDALAESLPRHPPSFGEQRTEYPRASRHSFTARNIDSSSRRRATHDWDSDDDDDLSPDMENEAYRRSAEFLFATDPDDERSMAAVRGALASGKRVPSKAALASLEPVKAEDLKDSDRTCIICYNELGVSNPEGLVEIPIRLPKCKHVFGDKCIKKWFEDSDSCPYCRDKLPSELSVRKTMAYEAYRARRDTMAAIARARAGPPRYSVADEQGSSRTASNPTHRTQDEYGFAVSRNIESSQPWDYSPSSRPSPADSPESRRRQARGRVGNNRASHLLGRPTSVGSARWISPSTNTASTSQRGHVFSIPPLNPSFGHMPRRSITPGLPRQANGTGSSNSSNSHTPPRTRLADGFASSPSSEEASPPVAVGSGVSRERRQDRHSETNSRRSLDTLHGPPIPEIASDLSMILSHPNNGHANVANLNRHRSSDTPSRISSTGELLAMEEGAGQQFQSERGYTNPEGQRGVVYHIQDPDLETSTIY